MFLKERKYDLDRNYTLGAGGGTAAVWLPHGFFFNEHCMPAIGADGFFAIRLQFHFSCARGAGQGQCLDVSFVHVVESLPLHNQITLIFFRHRETADCCSEAQTAKPLCADTVLDHDLLCTSYVSPDPSFTPI